MKDPTANEMRDFLGGQFASDVMDEFDVESAVYWFANNYHNGCSSNLYSALSTSEYRPGPIEGHCAKDSLAEMCYEALEREFGR